MLAEASQAFQFPAPVVAAFVAAVNAGDKAAFPADLALDANMSDDETGQGTNGWTEREVFSSGRPYGHGEPVSR
ncbi:hypothetical protein RI138_28860 [Streptomyces sp. C11-1]|uniref:Uncharacterized protein n=1 Tax=Streptomyces durocortorensis TaxID=2811104 RepID=A0ABY9W911_9ACTN|nr:hypothetical protein [Streptomyces durocortorensis]WNF30512.1 hypothetical protein RI138_28860 [Streptomyces durocortorensis]